MKPKTLIIGLDGAALDIIKDLGNDLPTLNYLIQNGVSSYLNSTIPPVTIPAWPAMFTGKNPGKLGTLDFLKVIKKSNSYELKPVNSSLWKGDMLWDFLSRENYRVGVINVPGTTPPWEVNGSMISDFFSPQKSSGIYPKELDQELKRKIPVYMDFRRLEDYATESQKLEIERQNTIILIKIMEFFDEKDDVDLLVNVLTLTDRAMHFTSNMEKLLDIYKFIDFQLSRMRIIEKVKERNYNLFIVSDHGAKRALRKFYINTWLKEKGYLFVRKEKSKLGSRILLIADFFNDKGFRPLFRLFSRYILPKLFGKSLEPQSNELTDELDWNKTQVFAFGLIDSSFFELWITEEGKRKKIEKKMVNELEELRDPKTGKKVIKMIYRAEDVYPGANKTDISDYMVELNHEYLAVVSLFPHTFASTKNFIHKRTNGTFIAYGPDIREGKELNHADITDITPTILHMYNIPIPADLDGRVLKEIFKESSELAKREIKYQRVPKEEEKKRIKRRIKELN